MAPPKQLAYLTWHACLRETVAAKRRSSLSQRAYANEIALEVADSFREVCVPDEETKEAQGGSADYLDALCLLACTTKANLLTNRRERAYFQLED